MQHIIGDCKAHGQPVNRVKRGKSRRVDLERVEQGQFQQVLRTSHLVVVSGLQPGTIVPSIAIAVDLGAASLGRSSLKIEELGV